MAKLRLGRFANPESISGIEPRLLRRFLEQFRADLEPRGIFTATGLDEDAVARLFTDLGPDVPDELIDQIGAIDEMARPANFDKLLGEATRLELEIGDDPSVGDLVVLLLLDAADSLERLYAEQLPLARRKFRSHLALTEEPPQVCAIADDIADALRLALDLDFVRRRRGGGVRVYPVEMDDGFRMMIRRGDVLHRETVVDLATATTKNIAFRPQRFDALIYKCADGELRVNAKTDADARAYLEHVGHHVFGLSTIFLGEGLPARYTLAPIVEQGQNCLECGDVPELLGVRLTALGWVNPGSGMPRRVGPFDDVFRGMRMDGESIPRGAILTNATFRVMYRGGREASHRVTRTNAAIRHNNVLYDSLNQRFEAMRDYFKRSRFTVLNCTPDSGLTAFEHLLFEDAVAKASAECGKKVNTKGWYT